MKSDALTDMLAILTAGGRLKGERSRALPQESYRDPAKSARFAGEKANKSKKKRRNR